jgi:hypothetical protein
MPLCGCCSAAAALQQAGLLQPAAELLCFATYAQTVASVMMQALRGVAVRGSVVQQFTMFVNFRVQLTQ